MAWTLGNLLTVIIGKLDVLTNLTQAFQAECISDLFILFSSLVALDSILVSTGYYYPGGSATKTEIINTDNSSLTCKDPEEYPLQVYGAVGGMASLPVICGGYDGSGKINQCYRMKSGKWNHFANLAQGYVLY